MMQNQLYPLLQVMCNVAKQGSGNVFQEEEVSLLMSGEGASKIGTLSHLCSLQYLYMQPEEKLC